MELVKGILGKAVTLVMGGAVLLGVIVAAYQWFQMSPEDRQAVWSGIGRVLIWLAVVAVLPWATFFIIARVAKRESNLAGGLLVAAYTGVGVVLLAWLFDWSIRGAAGWSFFLLAALLAAVYNLFTCDWLAEKLA